MADALTRDKVLTNSDPEPVETCCALYLMAFGIVFVSKHYPDVAVSPLTAGLFALIGDDALRLLGALMVALGAAQLGAIYHQLLWTRRVVLVFEVGWFLFAAALFGVALGLEIRPLLFAVFTGKSMWALSRLFRAGVSGVPE